MKSLEQGLPKTSARQRQAENEQPKARRIGRRPSLRSRLFGLQAFSSFKDAVPFNVRLCASEWRFALTSFAVKVALFWLLELAFCKWATERQICHLVEKGFLPCLFTYAVMDFLVIPPLRRRWDR